MDDPIKVSNEINAEVLLQIEKNDRCNALYMMWDKMRFRGRLGSRNLFSCHNFSCVPDARLQEILIEVVSESMPYEVDPVLVDRGEAILLLNTDPELLLMTFERLLEESLETL